MAEIGGGYLVWLWLRESKPLWYGVVGGIILVLYGVIPTLQNFPSFGRVYAAYGGVFVVLSVLWGCWVDKKTPDMYDWIGAVMQVFRLWYGHQGIRKTICKSFVFHYRVHVNHLS